MNAAVMATLLALGQAPAPPHQPSRDPALTRPAVEDRLLEQQKKRLNTDPVSPATRPPSQAAIPGVPAPAGVTLAAKGVRTYPEGSFVAPRTGAIVKAGSGDFVFVPERGEQGPSDPPFVLLPCETLTQIAGAPGEGPVSIGGQVFIYRGRHYLLPTSFTREVAPAAVEAPSQPATPPPADPSVQDLMRMLEDGAGRAVPPPTPVDADPTARRPPVGVARGEGTVLVSKRARLVRLPGAGGQFGATIDNDTNSPAELPMVLLPCRALERLEAVASWRGEDTAFLLSGRVYTYDGRNFVLPVLVQVQRETDVAPMQ